MRWDWTCACNAAKCPVKVDGPNTLCMNCKAGGHEVDKCLFCEIGDGLTDREFEQRGPMMIFVPQPVLVPGHLLVAPKFHIRDARDAPDIAGLLVKAGTELLNGRDGHVAINCGPAAWQQVEHLHVHVLPREKGDTWRVLRTGVKERLRQRRHK